MKAEKIVLNEEREVSLTAYIQEVDGEFGFSRRPAMLVIPGGGYAICSDREADPVAAAYLKAGFQSIILRYTVKAKGGWPHQLEDYENAMTIIEENAEEWHIDPSKIAVAGFSAGGHLAACAATLAKHKPAAAVLAYPAILEDIVDSCQPNMPYPYQHVTPQTSPCFIVAARDDRTVHVKNALVFEQALAENGVAFESHIYSFGGHGFSTAEDWINTNSVCPRLPEWIKYSVDWLGEVMGKLTRNGFTEPVAALSLNADYSPVLSVECSLKHLCKQSDEAKNILAPMFTGIEAVATARGFDVELLKASVGNNTAREIMEMVQIPKDTIFEIDRKLHDIVNNLEV